MSPTVQNTRAQRNAALARSSSSTGHVVNVRYWHKAVIKISRRHVRPKRTQTGRWHRWSRAPLGIEVSRSDLGGNAAHFCSDSHPQGILWPSTLSAVAPAPGPTADDEEGACANDDFAVACDVRRIVAERDGRPVVVAAGGVALDTPGPNAGEEMPIG